MMLICFGTRPEYVKIKPVLEAIRGHIDYKLLFTGQHVDLLSNINEEVTKLAIVNGSNRLDSIVESLMNTDPDIFDGVSSVLVQGDTTSVFAIALGAFHRRIKIIHLEAGLRSYNIDHPYPEEFNRRAVSIMADLHLCPTEESAQNLRSEKVDGKIFVVGNTVLDHLTEVETSYQNKVTVTLHRRENHPIMNTWFLALEDLANEFPQYEFVLPIHPNPNVQRHRDLLEKVKVIDPLPHNEFIDLLANSKLVITDSGGLQEESSFLRKKCIVCREYTERIEGMGTFSVTSTPLDLRDNFISLIDDHIPEGECPYGDGHSGAKIRNVLLSEGF
ncbi:non-hydrolyzing UDP-N-acetylglucosamine 2-epimerase [Hyphomonas sp.]|uniref:non-hydrolyzing UDP-N-acetylglucosamine 2-epimerase n=1 Tax=Hyphomonas sp. TaxID=87 RepID=UPI000C91035E|nr:UDP-N-acetylglucosamine 2-epimerase (non-hydrolyzing) [Hyphomonas sp.]MAL45776.1 UDP-N-acetylglucosamine 2-epimerase (non-hydrolyzing) [Hyphomonas sp.]